MRRKLRRVQSGLLDARFQDEVDGLPRHRAPTEVCRLAFNCENAPRSGW